MQCCIKSIMEIKAPGLLIIGVLQNHSSLHVRVMNVQSQPICVLASYKEGYQPQRSAMACDAGSSLEQHASDADKTLHVCTAGEEAMPAKRKILEAALAPSDGPEEPVAAKRKRSNQATAAKPELPNSSQVLRPCRLYFKCIILFEDDGLPNLPSSVCLFLVGADCLAAPQRPSLKRDS